MQGALDGLVVLDLTNFLSGPYCTMLLGDMGADVIKVERPDGGDDARRMPPFVENRGQPFAVWNRNKRSITADLKNPDDVALVKRLAARADVLVENFRPGTLAKLGLGYDVLSAENPRLIWCSISGFGQTGPWAGHGGLDMMAQGMSGLMAGNGPPDGEPYRLPIAITDVTAGMYSAIAVLGALQARNRTGRGQQIDQSLLEAGISLGVYEAAHVFTHGTRPERLGQLHRGSAPYRVFRTADGWITLGASKEKFFTQLCEIIGQPTLRDDPRFASNAQRVKHNAALIAIIQAELAKHPSALWLKALGAAGIPSEPVLSYDEALAHPQAQARGTVVEFVDAERGPVKHLAPPVRLAETPAMVRRRAPDLGEHNAEIRAWLDGE
jgi:crotonobetainyl-CoA:carnitine CoA-transferase CaiB-like acyl-CoA transferase